MELEAKIVFLNPSDEGYLLEYKGFWPIPIQDWL